MTKAPVSVCLIARNESEHLEKTIASVRPYVAEVCITDTGSTDGSEKLAQKLADRFQVYTGCNDRNRRIKNFADARRASFALATQPHIFWIDADDVVVNAEKLPDLVASLKPDHFVSMRYDYMQAPNGMSVCSHWRERIVPRDKFRWTGVVHEVLIPASLRAGCPHCMIESGEKIAEPSPLGVVEEPEIYIKHERQRLDASRRTVDPERNLRILREHRETHGDAEVRNEYYLGCELAAVGKPREAMVHWRLYVARSGWEDERTLACLEMAKWHQHFGEYQEAVEWACRSFVITETWAEPFFSLGRSYYELAKAEKGDKAPHWRKCASFIRRGLAMEPTRTALWTNPFERAFDVHRYLNVALAGVGDLSGALDSCRTALAVQDDPELRENAITYEAQIAKTMADNAVLSLLRLGKMTPEQAKLSREVLAGAYVLRLPEKTPATGTTSQPPPSPQARPLPVSGGLQSPGPSGGHAPAEGTATRVAPSGGDSGHLSIVIITGPALEPWNPDTIATGPMGGSEVMAWEIARRLARLGHTVTLVGHCPGISGVFEGVTFRDSQTEEVPDSCDVLLCSRSADFVRCGIAHKKAFLWVHDVCPSWMTPELAKLYDGVIALSEWHRGYMLRKLPFLRPEQVVIVRNGVDLSRFEGSEPRNAHRAICSSSPDRYLLSMLQMWPRIRVRVPDAELHLFYSFENWRKVATMVGDASQLGMIMQLEARIKELGDQGVTMHGRVGQKELAREFMRSGVWLYPTWAWADGEEAGETSCISAMEAQAAGCHMVTSPVAALKETASRAVLVDGDWLSAGYQYDFVKYTCDIMRFPQSSPAVMKARQDMKDHARDNFDLDARALEWEGLFKG